MSLSAAFLSDHQVQQLPWSMDPNWFDSRCLFFCLSTKSSTYLYEVKTYKTNRFERNLTCVNDVRFRCNTVVNREIDIWWFQTSSGERKKEWMRCRCSLERSLYQRAQLDNSGDKFYHSVSVSLFHRCTCAYAIDTVNDEIDSSSMNCVLMRCSPRAFASPSQWQW